MIESREQVTQRIVAIKELIHEEFGDGIMSAIDFSMDIKREQDASGDRVNIVLSGKFLPYKSYQDKANPLLQRSQAILSRSKT